MAERFDPSRVGEIVWDAVRGRGWEDRALAHGYSI
jgi:hypothetical protein